MTTTENSCADALTDALERRLRVLIGTVNAYEKATGVGGWYAERIQEECNFLLKVAGSEVRFGLGYENPVEQPAAAPIPMLLFCPRCGTQHVDRQEVHSEADASIGLQIKEVVTWDNPPHRSHLCHACGVIWRPADIATVGVQSIETHGKADTWTAEMPWTGHNRTAPTPIDRRHVGDSKFEGWYSSYAVKRESNPKQIARDAYAAGMGDMTPQPAPSPADERADDEPWPQKNEYFAAWLAICNTLEEVAPEWHHGEECGMDKACRAIRAMAAKIKDFSSDVRHIYGAYGDACARAASANETGAEAVAIPSDYALVPIEPTEEMITAGIAKGDAEFYGDALVRAEVRSDYRAMVAAYVPPLEERGPCICQEDLGNPGGTCAWKNGHAPCAAPQPAQEDARVGLTADMRDVLGGNFGALEQAEDLCRATGNDSSADGLNALSYALRALLQGANHAE